MEPLIPSASVEAMVGVSLQDETAEMEVKVLAGKIQTKDIADRIVKAIQGITNGPPTEEHRATFSYQDGLRVSVTGLNNIQKVCVSGNFRSVPLLVERKVSYFDVVQKGQDKIELPEWNLRFTLRKEETLRKDFSGSANDPSNHIRIMNRKSWKTADGVLRIDMSLVKSKSKARRTIPEILRQQPSFELEVEVLDKSVDAPTIVKSMNRTIEVLLAAYQGSPFLLKASDMEKYRLEFETMRYKFLSPVTMERRHLRADRPNSILKGYSVTNKADGERSFLVVSKDRRVVRITPSNKITWTGLLVKENSVHIGNVIDGEYLESLNIFCIFDVYRYKGKDMRNKPLMLDTEDAETSRLGCASDLIRSIHSGEFYTIGSQSIRIQKKMFLGGDMQSMQDSIVKLLTTQFEYPTDGLIFTPRGPMPAPHEIRGSVWNTVYKWKPPHQNSIDFLVRFNPTETFDPVLNTRVFKGNLYVSRSPHTDIIYPCETMTGEYKVPEPPADIGNSTEERGPAPFQPSAPRDPSANEISIPLSPTGIPIDEEGQRIEDNTILECSRDTEKGKWKIMRTRYDKTYQYRVLQKPQFGNDIKVAENIWTNIHNPVTEEMLRLVYSSPPSDTFEDELYYRDTLEARDRVLKDVYAFHNRIKDTLYANNLHKQETLLELAVGRGGDMHKWRKCQPKFVVGIDLHARNLDAPRQGACVRYLNDKQKLKLPPALFIQADMLQPLYDQDNKYIRILAGKDKAPTEYLKTFENIPEYDVVACQFAIHYACESEEVFRGFVKNLKKHCKTLFFGTCLDGREVYAKLLGKKSHTFLADNRVFGEFTKEYEDGDGWKEEFGQAIVVKLESFEEQQKEFLVPFEKVKEIFKEAGFHLTQTTDFKEYYNNQKREEEFRFSVQHQEFSFLHRSFVFTKSEEEEVKPETEPEEEEQVKTETEREEEEVKTEMKEGDETQEVEIPVAQPETIVKGKRTIKIKEKKPISPEEEPVLFFMGNDKLGENNYLSNMFEAKFQVDGITFPTVEHYFQWAKAKMFGAEETATKILASPSAKTAKALGGPTKKAIEGYDSVKWEEKKLDVMKTALKAKFTQHPELREKLLGTTPRPLGEANARDAYWGIGTSAETTKASNPAKWKRNMTGKLLMDLRKELSA